MSDDKEHVIVSAGSTLEYIKDFLKEYGLRILGNPESKTITVGGAVLMGSHSGSKIVGCLAEYVTDMWLIDGTGNVQHITDTNLFINYGTLGVVFRIKIKCFTAKNTEFIHTTYDNVDDIEITDNTHSIVFDPYSNKCEKSDMSFVNKDEEYSVSYKLWYATRYVSSIQVLTNTVSTMINYIPSIAKITSKFAIGNPDVIKNKFDYFDTIPDKVKLYDLEYSIPINKWKDCYRDAMKLIQKNAKKADMLHTLSG